MKKIVLLIAVLLLSQVSAWGMQFLSRDEIVLDKHVQVDEDIYMAGEKVLFMGLALQDVFIAASSQVMVSGKIMQDLNVAAVDAEITATVEDDVRVIGSEIVFSGSVMGSTLILGSEIFLRPESMFEKDVWLLGADVHMSGIVNGNVGIKADKVLIDGTVTGNLFITADSIVLGRKARILGQLEYICKQEIQTNTGAVVQYPPNWKTAAHTSGGEGDSGWKDIWNMSKIVFRITVYLGVLLFGCLFVMLVPNPTRRYAMVIRYKFWPSLGWGALTVLGILILLTVLIVSLIGIPLAIILGLLALVIMLAAGIGMGYMLGILLLKPKEGKTGRSLGAMALGFTLLTLVGLIPILGGLLMALVILVGFGAMWLSKGFEEPTKTGLLKSKPEKTSAAVTAKVSKPEATQPAAPKPEVKSKATTAWQPPVPAFKQAKGKTKTSVKKKVLKVKKVVSKAKVVKKKTVSKPKAVKKKVVSKPKTTKKKSVNKPTGAKKKSVSKKVVKKTVKKK
jgi:cytoskeletal protein CcmA (bactofilin family)